MSGGGSIPPTSDSSNSIIQPEDIMYSIGTAFLYGETPKLKKGITYIAKRKVTLLDGRKELTLPEGAYFTKEDIPDNYLSQIKACLRNRLVVEFKEPEPVVQVVEEIHNNISELEQSILDGIAEASKIRTHDLVARLLSVDKTHETVVVTPDVIDDTVSESTSTILEAKEALIEIANQKELGAVEDTEDVEDEVVHSKVQISTKDRILAIAEKRRNKKRTIDKIKKIAAKRKNGDV